MPLSTHQNLRINAAKREIECLQGSSMVRISYDEVEAFSAQLWLLLGGDKRLSKYFPIGPTFSLDESQEHPFGLFKAIEDGILYVHLINLIQPNSIDLRVLECKSDNLGRIKARRMENMKLIINTCISIGISTENLNVVMLMNWQDFPMHSLGMVWSLLHRASLLKVDLHENKNLASLLQPGESIEDLLRLDSESLLKRWVNHHLERAGEQRRVSNLGPDMSDCFVYTKVLDRIGQTGGELQRVYDANPNDKRAVAKKIIEHVQSKYGIQWNISEEFILGGNEKINVMFISNIYNANPFLEEVTETIDELDSDVGDSRLEKVLTRWIKSVVPEARFSSLIAECRDSLLMLKVLNAMAVEKYPGESEEMIQWKKTKQEPKNPFHKMQNISYALKFGLKFYNYETVQLLDSIDVHEGRKKQILGWVFTLMMSHVKVRLASFRKNKMAVEDGDILNWAKGKTACIELNAFSSPAWRTGNIQLDIIDSIRKGIINRSYITPGYKDQEMEEEKKEQNVSYALTLARSLGAIIFGGVEDIVQKGMLSSKMNLMFCVEMMKIEDNMKGKKE